MSNVKQPYTSITKASASLPAGLAAQKMLVIGQKLATGTAIEKTLITDVVKEDIDKLVGLESMLGKQLSAVFEEFEQAPSPYLPRVDIIALEDSGTAVKAEATITLSASGGDDTINEAGVIDFDICGESFELAVEEGDSITGDIAPALVSAINLLFDEAAPFVASNVGGVVTLEAVNGGTVLNKGTIKVEGLKKTGGNYFFSNMQVAIVNFTGGLNDPVLTNLLDVADRVRYQTITYPYGYGTDLATDFLDPRWNVANAIKDGVAILKNTDAKADFETTLAALNSKCLVVLCNKEVTEDLFKGGEDLEYDFIAAARVAAVRALRLTEGANIVNLTPASTNGELDAAGGMHIASLPYANTPVSGSPLQPIGRGWKDEEIADLKVVGGSIMGNNTADNGVILGEIVTTYKTDSAGNDDPTWKNLEQVDTMSVCAEYFFNNLKKDYVQSRLTAGDIVKGYSMVNEGSYISKMQSYYLALGDKALVPKSKAATNFFLSNLSVVLDMVLGKITSSNELPIVVQLRQIIATLKTNFSQNLV